MTAASFSEDSGTAALDPRIGTLGAYMQLLNERATDDHATILLNAIDVADRAAGYMRIKADAETVEKVAEVLARVFGGAPATSHVWRHDARAVPEALTNG